MSHDTQGANEPHDDGSTETETEAEVETITSLEEAQAAFAELGERRETRVYKIPTETGVKEVTFTIRALEADERDEIESVAARQQEKAEGRSRGGTSDKIEIWPVKVEQLRFGIADSSIDGFKPAREDHLKRLPSYIQDDLFTAIDDLGSLETEVREGFPSMG